ncbi:MAG TPA: HAD-IB family hydrolase, partial [Blastocatellia bacterium]|nr:HAD-IB family hydrolase [Blastocatellia bacterium]
APKSNMSKQTIAAVFDVDGTLIAGASLEARFISFLWRYGEITARDLARLSIGAWQAIIAGRSPIRANKAYLCGKDKERMKLIAEDCFHQVVKRQLLPRAVERLRWHQESGHSTTLLSGSLDLILEPLASHLGVNAYVGTKPQTDGDHLTGQIAGEHPYSNAKVTCLNSLCTNYSFDLSRSFAYANHYTDRYLLATVGNPVAANPDRRLCHFAQRHGWLIEDFIN